MFQPKDTDWLNGYKNKIYIYIYTHTHTHTYIYIYIYIYAVYKKPTSDLKTHTD